MRILIQRVQCASVSVDGTVESSIGRGLLMLLGIAVEDSPEDIDWLTSRIVKLRIFPDESGAMNQSVMDVGGGLLVVPQFTLMASTRKGNRPSFLRAARPDAAIPLFELFLKALETAAGKPVGRGIFGADMQISLINDGPVTLWLDSEVRE